MLNQILRCFALSSLVSFSVNSAYACIDSQSIQKLEENEKKHLISRNVATMTDAIQDKLLLVQIERANKLDERCQVSITYSLPSEDIAEANQLMNANPAKRIMLAGQGYELPNQTMLTAVADIDPITLLIQHADILQSAPLGKNRASVELLYATLAQNRALISTHSENATPWPSSLLEQEKNICEKLYTSDSNPNACTCKTEAISKKVSARQLSYIRYLANDPYSSATGALASYRELSEQVDFECKLKKRG